MEIEVRLYGRFRELAAAPSFPLWIGEGTTVGEVMDRLGLPGPAYRLALVKGIRASESTVLRPGDELQLFQPVGGG